MPVIVHIDMNSFFASCEVKKDPELKGKKLIIGGLSNRSIVSAASYEAKRDGIYTTMPIYLAKEKCKDGIIHFCLSSKISSTYNNAISASKKFDNVYVIDSESLSSGIGLQVLYAIELRDKIEELKCKQMGKEYKQKIKVEKTREKVYERTRKSHHV